MLLSPFKHFPKIGAAFRDKIKWLNHHQSGFYSVPFFCAFSSDLSGYGLQD